CSAGYSGSTDPRPSPAQIACYYFHALRVALWAMHDCGCFSGYGDNHVRFAPVESKERTRQALRGIKQMLAKGLVVS
ncbi:MAG: hypothetical protein ABSB50_19360, partial [Terracidiphilus sp.]